MLVSLAITLIMMGAVVTLFGVVSESVSGARSAIEMADRLRGAKEQLQLDLQGVTATMKPPLRPENNEGYFEIIEGQFSDDSARLLNASTLFGDIDDVLMFTTRNRSAPFLGKLNTGTATINESTDAEVIYFLVQDGPVIDATPVAPNPPVRLSTLYRRVLLISPTIPNNTTFANTFYTNNDLSVRFQTIGGTATLVPNTLGDLTKRENRFAHNGVNTYAQFPFLVDTAISPEIPFVFPAVTPAKPAGPFWPQENAYLQPFEKERLGDDVLLTNVISFDVRVFDPQAPLIENGGVVTEPNDPGWAAAGTIVARGAYVDLGYGPVTPNTGLDQVNPNAVPAGNFGTANTDDRIYDTWSLHYENDGVSAAGTVITAGNPGDRGTDGLDDPAVGTTGVVDDIGEFDTQPPYAVPLRGIKVTIRTYEPSSQQVREAVVIQNFDTK